VLLSSTFCQILASKALTGKPKGVLKFVQYYKTRGLYYKHITIVNDDSSVVSEWYSKVWRHLRA